MSDQLNREQLLARLCAMGKRVQDHLGYQYAADCFCGENPLSVREAGGPFRWDSEVLDFIGAAIDTAITSARGGRSAPPNPETPTAAGGSRTPE